MADLDAELLFLDTFSHENSEELNLDLVQFPRPVVIYEVRVIPLQTRVQVDVPGGTRLGATNPSNFKLELFVNNLSKPNASTFERLGILDYKENIEIQLKADSELQIPTDGLILKGWYTALTIAVYGILTSVKSEPSSPPPPPPPPQQPQQPVHTQPKPKPQSVTEGKQEWEVRPSHQQHPLDFIEQQIQQSLQQPSQQTVPQPVPLPVPQPQQIPPQQVPPQVPQPVPIPVPQQGPQPVPQPVPVPIQQPTPQPQPVPPVIPQNIYEQFDQPLVPPEFTQNIPEHREQEPPPREPFQPSPAEPEKPFREIFPRDFHEENQSLDSYDVNYFKGGPDTQDPSNRDRRDFRESREGSREPRDIRGDWGESREPHEFREREREKFVPRHRDRDRYRDFDNLQDRTRTPPKHGRSRSRSPRNRRSRSHSPPRKPRSPSAPKSPTSPPARLQRSISRSPPALTREVSPRSMPIPMPSRLMMGMDEMDRDMHRGMMPLERMDRLERMDEMYENLSQSPEPDPINEMFMMSDGEIQDEDDGYEDISSDEEMIRTIPASTELDYDMDESWNSMAFKPFQFEVTALLELEDPSLTEYELEKSLLQLDTCELDEPAEALTLKNLVQQFSQTDHHDKWVEALEEIPDLLPKGLSYLRNQGDNTVLNALLEWTLEGLNMEKAALQPESVYKVRHLKIGIKLAGAICICDDDVATQCLAREVQHKLVDLFEAPHMSLSLKQQIIRALDQTTRLHDGIQWMLGIHPQQEVAAYRRRTGTSNISSQPEITCYQRLLELMLSKQLVRTMMSLKCLMRKLHTYEVMKKFGQSVERVLENISSAEEEPTNNIGEDGDVTEPEVETTMRSSINEAHADNIVTCLEEITKMFYLAPYLLAQPKRTFPRKTLFEVKQQPNDVIPNLYHMAHSCRLLECLFIIVSSPSIVSHPAVYCTVRDFLVHLLQTRRGLLFLISRPETTNGILRSLMQITDFNREEGTEETVSQQLGLEVVYHLQTLQYIDQLLDYHAKAPEDKIQDNANTLGVLQNLCGMTFTPVGREAVVKVLSMEDSLTALIPFMELQGNDEEDTKIKKSVFIGYTTELLLMLVHHSEDVEMLQKYGAKLLAICENGFNAKLNDLKEWLMPVKRISSYSTEGIASVITELRQLSEELPKLPRGLVTVIRIMHHLCIPPDAPFKEGALAFRKNEKTVVETVDCESSDRQEELKYKYVLLEVFSADCLNSFTQILQRICAILLRPWQMGIPPIPDQAAFYIAIIKPAMEIIRSTIQILIMARSSQFKDLTLLSVLFQLHTVCSVPFSNLYIEDIQYIQKTIIDTLMAYTQPVLKQSETDEVISQSLWTQTIKELFKYTLKTPYAFLSGLMIFSELLPLPLPLQTKEPLGKKEVIIAINMRKLWSAHLHPLSEQFLEVFQALAGTNCHPLQMILKRVCMQMADLASPTALMITKCLLGVLCDSIKVVNRIARLDDRKEDDKEEGLNELDDMALNFSLSHCSRILNLLADLLSQPAIKCSMLNLINFESKEEDNVMYRELLPQMIRIMNIASDKPCHVQCQEMIVSIIQSLCDTEITLVTGETSLTLSEQIVNALPQPAELSIITSALLEHMGNMDHHYTSVLPCVRTVIMLTEHDYGFYHLKCALDKYPMVLHRLLTRINSTFSKEIPDCLPTLSTTLELLRLFVTIEMPEEETSVIRTYLLSFKELQTILNWNCESVHPLFELEKLLEMCGKDDEIVLAGISSLIKLLNTEENESGSSKPEIVEPTLPSLESLSTLFDMRAVFMISDADDERLSPTYWLSNPLSEEPDQEPELIRCNLEELCSKYCNEFNLEEELKKGSVPTAEDRVKPKRLRPQRRSHEGINIGREKGGRKPYVAPMRGRGIARQVNNTRHDPFRSRPPNTSRPPSMHVDDFNKMVTSDTRPPLQDIQPLRRLEKEPLQQHTHTRGRGRGSDRGRGFGGGRSRFFTPPGNYSRRESFRGGGSGGDHGGGNHSGRSKPDFLSPRPLQRGRDMAYTEMSNPQVPQLMSQENRPAVTERRPREMRFSPGGRGHWRGRGKDMTEPRFGPRGRRDPGPGRHVRSFTK